MRTVKEIQSELNRVNQDIKEAEERDWEAYAQEIIDKLFDEFPDGAAWLKDAVYLVKRYGHVMSPDGRVRRLWRVHTGKRSVIAAASRRAQNSPIQGFASQVGCSSGFLILRESYLIIKELGLDVKSNMPKYCKAVHDANYFVVPYSFMIYFLHISQYQATNGVTDWYKQVFGFDFTIEPEIELEVGASESKFSSYKWSWEIPELLQIIYRSLQHQSAMGRLDSAKIPDTFDLIIQPWVDLKTRMFLQERYPLLNVKGLDDVINSSLNRFKAPTLEVST